MKTKGFSILQQLAAMRDMIQNMEHDLGIDSLTPNERDILLAFYANARTDAENRTVCSTDVVRAHPTVSRISQPTFHRTLRKLVQQGLVINDKSLPAGVYVIPTE